MRVASLTSFLLMVVGALNWLLVGTSHFDLVRKLFGRDSLPGRIVYSLVGVAGLFQLGSYLTRLARGQYSPATP